MRAGKLPAIVSAAVLFAVGLLILSLAVSSGRADHAPQYRADGVVAASSMAIGACIAPAMWRPGPMGLRSLGPGVTAWDIISPRTETTQVLTGAGLRWTAHRFRPNPITVHGGRSRTPTTQRR